VTTDFRGEELLDGAPDMKQAKMSCKLQSEFLAHRIKGSTDEPNQTWWQADSKTQESSSTCGSIDSQAAVRGVPLLHSSHSQAVGQAAAHGVGWHDLEWTLWQEAGSAFQPAENQFTQCETVCGAAFGDDEAAGDRLSRAGRHMNGPVHNNEQDSACSGGSDLEPTRRRRSLTQLQQATREVYPSWSVRNMLMQGLLGKWTSQKVTPEANPVDMDPHNIVEFGRMKL